jgi:Ras-related protein Rab-7A
MKAYKFKICIFGDGGVGKTTLTHRYMTGIFEEKYQLTIGMDFYLKKLKVEEDDISLQIWDFAGEEKFRFLMPGALTGAQAAIFMYDLSRYNTLENLSNWISLFKETIQKENQDIPFILVGSKLDLKEIRAVSKEKGLEMANQHGAIGWIECSAKDGTNVSLIFSEMARGIIEIQFTEKKKKKINLFQ